MKDYIELGSSPCDEDCVQVNPNGDYRVAMSEELERYKTMLKARFPVPADVRAWFGVKWFPHDFGSYGEVVVFYHDDDEESASFAYHVEENLPATWDDSSVIPYTHEEPEEPEENPSCPACDGIGVPLGNLGNTHYFRCQDCGLTFSGPATDDFRR